MQILVADVSTSMLSEGVRGTEIRDEDATEWQGESVRLGSVWVSENGLEAERRRKKSFAGGGVEARWGQNPDISDPIGDISMSWFDKPARKGESLESMRSSW
jgi:hypothetical protein